MRFRENLGLFRVQCMETFSMLAELKVILKLSDLSITTD